MLKHLLDRLLGRGPAEDVEPDPNLANTRATGGMPSQAGDAAASTGTGATGEYVGRIAGQDEGFAGHTGAEERADSDRTEPGARRRR
ncbi:hypothetical protein SAMN05216207_105818 [Pseudonocardia ammonioxydans]|uniref:Uncharacterized protein n=1 Tax=Pseudonocardia ammonioxydans TaxID=260086 RepID=A0A1I5H6F9_PSUAM|nr:hypothetical protein [Pseudonocardia ammonioxydans]SFO43797.1 hypothetical protein SAMN05216207_105818 [Pseudonocardia ammonioxydans]